MRYDIGRRWINIVEVGNGTPVVFLHGRGGNWRDWDRQLAAFASRYRCIALDLPGHGSSGALACPTSVGELAEDVLDALRLVDVERALFVGLSLGGFIAQHIAVHQRDRVAGLVLVNTVASMGFVDRALADAGRAIYALGPGDPYRMVTAAGVERGFGERTRATRPDVIVRMTHEVLSTDVQTFAHLHDAIVGHDLAAQLTKVEAPTLVVIGREDVLAPPVETGRLADLIPGATSVEVDAGHVANVDDPDGFNRVVAPFLERVLGSSSDRGGD